MSKKYTYHTSHSFIIVENEKKTSMQSQLYQVGVYVIVNSDPSMQFNATPAMMVKQEKVLNKALEDNEIKDLVYGLKITVQEVDGLWKQIE